MLICDGLELFFSEVTDSTSSEARRYAEKYLPTSPVIFVSLSQSAGRGRLGRSFYSPTGSGLYMTLLLCMPSQPETVSRITPVCAVAAARALRACFGVETEIKWVNDLYMNHRKVAGILAESFVCGETRYLALGIGINLTTSLFPEDIVHKAGALLSGGSRMSGAELSELARLISKNILSAISDTDLQTEYMGEYKRRSCVLGRRIAFVHGGEKKHGLAVDISCDGALVIRMGDENIMLKSGEVSVFTADGEEW